jgi:hypothetical protein
LPLIRCFIPEAKYFSIQTGELRKPAMTAASDKRMDTDTGKQRDIPIDPGPEVVLWAGGRFSAEGAKPPPGHWQPKLVVDLNYRDDSGGRELARLTGARYLSGLEMFNVQAEHQRLFWEPFLRVRCRDRKR